MSVAYEVWLADPWGRVLRVLDGFEALEVARTENAVGALTLTLGAEFPRAMFPRDSRLLVWRGLDGGAPRLLLQTVWLVSGAARAMDGQGRLSTTVTAQDAMTLLARRIVAYGAGSSQAQKSGPADDLMKAVVRENLGSLATDAARSWAALLAVAPNWGKGAAVTKGFAWRNVLTVLQELAATSSQAGTYLAFDMVADARGGLTFETFVGQRGQDRRWGKSEQALLLAAEVGNVAEPSLGMEASEERTFVYAGGQGEGVARAVATASDAGRIAASPFGRSEGFRDARHIADAAGLLDEARAELAGSLARWQFGGRLVETAGTRFGVDWDWGDRVVAQFDGESVECRLSTVHVTVAGERETIDVQLQGVA